MPPAWNQSICLGFLRCLVLLGAASARAEPADLFRTIGFESPVHGGPGDLLWLPGSGIQSGDQVELVARVTGHWGFSWGGRGRRLHIEVRMPKDADLNAHTGDGSVEASAINGNVTVETGDGAIRANTLTGTIDLHTHDGSINVDTLKGEIRLRTGDGSIEGRELDGKLDADSGDGHVRVAGRFDSLLIHTGDGSVDTRVLPGSKMAGNWNIRTGDGSVDLALPGDFQANIDASTGDGHISVGLPVTVEGTFSNSQLHGKMNGGGQSLTVHTGDGSIRLSKA